MNPFSLLFRSIEVVDGRVRKEFKRRRVLLYLFLSLYRVPGFHEFGIKNEIKWNKILKDMEFKVPKIYDFNDNTIEREFIKGKTLDEELTPETCGKLGKLLAQLYGKGVSLGGDTKFGNFVFKDGGIIMIDTECAGYADERDPSLGLRLAMEQILVKKKEPDEYIQNFVKNYLENGGDKSYLAEIGRPRYEISFILSPFAFCDKLTEILFAYWRKVTRSKTFFQKYRSLKL